MAMVSVTYDLPSRQTDIKAYTEKTKGWIDINLAQPGVREFRGHRSANGASPQIVIQTEFDKLANANAWASSDALKKLISGMRAVGCSNITVRTWDASPILPQPIRK